MRNKNKMRKILTLLTLFVLLFPVSRCFGQENAQPNYDDNSTLNPLFEKELEDAGIAKNALTHDMSNFHDGNFKLTDAIISAIMSDRILLNNPEIRENLKKNINNNKTLVFPWSNTGTVKLVKEDGNLLAELHQDSDDDTSLSQGVSFRGSNAAIRFYLETVNANPDDVLKVEMRYTAADSELKTITLDTYNLSNLSRQNNLTIDLSQKSRFVSALRELKGNAGKYQPIADVVFRLEGRKNKDKPTAIRLGNFNISYSN